MLDFLFAAMWVLVTATLALTAYNAYQLLPARPKRARIPRSGC